MQRCEAIDLGDVHAEVSAERSAARDQTGLPTNNQYAVVHDVPDLLAFLVATGRRIGEALGLAWDRADLDHGTVVIDRQAIRIKGQSLRWMPT